MKFLVILLGLVSLGSSSPYRKVTLCTPDQSNQETYCGRGWAAACTTLHPDQEWCKDETAPLPSCCKATEKGTKITACGCCGYGKKASVSQHGVFAAHHEPPIVEYDIR